MAKSLRPFALILILLLAAGLRLAGLHWGLPDASHPDYSYHPDEALTVLWARDLAHGVLLAKQFIYGGTFYYSMLNAYYHYGTLLSPLLHNVGPMADTIEIGRYFTAAFSLLTIVLVYQIGKRLFGDATGLIAAALLAISPGHVFLAQNLRPDETSTFLAALLLYCSTLILQGGAASDRRHFILAGLLLGVAVALRFPLAVLGLGPSLAHLLRQRDGSRVQRLMQTVWKLPLLLLPAVLAYALASPHSLLHFDWLLRGLEVQRAYQTGTFADAVDRGPGIYQYGWSMLRQALGIPLYLLVLAGLVLACFRPTPGRILVLLQALVLFAPLTVASWVVMRYTLPLLPLLLLLAADGLVTVAAQGRARRFAVCAAMAAALCWTLLADAAFLRVETGRNVRDLIAGWMQQHIPAGTRIVTVEAYAGDVFLNPIIPAGYHPGVYLLASGDASPLLAPDAERDYLVLSGALYRNMDRLGPRNPQPGAYALQQALDGRGYRLAAEVVQPVRVLGIDFDEQFSSQDYQIVNPGERIYQRLPLPQNGAAGQPQPVPGT